MLRKKSLLDRHDGKDMAISRKTCVSKLVISLRRGQLAIVRICLMSHGFVAAQADFWDEGPNVLAARFSPKYVDFGGVCAVHALFHSGKLEFASRYG